MRLVEALLRKFGPKRRDDPVFGTMRYMGDRLKYWECETRFAPTSSLIEVFVDGSSDDNMEQQKAFFQELLREWPTVAENIGKVLLEEWNKRNPDSRAQSAWELFNLTSLSVPTASIREAHWEISFSPFEPDLLWTVHLEGTVAREVTIEG
jgi:hypothetical protein